MLGMMPRWLYGRGDPAEALRFEKPLAHLKERLDSGERVFEDLLQRLIVDNDHLATVELVPDAELADKQKKEEEAVLAAAKAKMSPEQIQKVIEETKTLKEAQLQGGYSGAAGVHPACRHPRSRAYGQDVPDRL